MYKKKCYCNPLKDEEHFCLFTALVGYLSVNQEHLYCTERLFINPGVQLLSASQTFGCQICQIAKRFAPVIKKILLPVSFNIHRLSHHLFSSVYINCCTCSEWSMGKVLDVCFQCAAQGNCYLGEQLSFKDTNCVEFNMLCPHWHDPNHPAITEVLDLSFGHILVQHGSTNFAC